MVAIRLNKRGQDPMSKKYIGKPCAYCGGMSTTADHVFPRKFFSREVSDLPKVPACKTCNGKKSGLERDAIALFSLVGRHPDSIKNFNDNALRRLAKTPELRRSMAQSTEKLVEDGGLLVQEPTIRVEASSLKRLSAFIACGLSYFWLNVQVNPDACDVGVAEQNCIDLLRRKAKWLSAQDRCRYVTRDLGNRTIIYEGVAPALPFKAIWWFSIHGAHFTQRGPTTLQWFVVHVKAASPS